MKVRLFVGAVLLLALTNTYAQGMGDMAPMHGKMGDGNIMMAPPGGMGGTPPVLLDIPEIVKFMDNIGIAKPTSAKIATIARTFVTAFNEKIIKLQKEELNIREELLKDKPDMQVIQASIIKKTQVLGEIEFAQIKRDVDIKSLLTQDEYEKWKSHIMDHMRQMRDARSERKGDIKEPQGK